MTVYIVLKNADFIEGRGPMMFEKCFSTVPALEKWCNSKEYGIYGWKPEGMSFFHALWSAKTELGKKKPSSPYGGWEG